MGNNIAVLKRDFIRIMGNQHYDEVKDFYKHVFEADATKVIVEGRTYALYKIFESIFESEGCVKVGKVYTTHAISQIPKGQEKVLLVADVIEDVNSILDYINKLSSLNVTGLYNIVLWCIACNNKLVFVDKLKSYFKHVIYEMPTEIRQLSILLSKVVMRVNVGYFSFVNSYRFKTLTFDDISKVKYRCLIENDLQSFSDNKMISKVLWSDFFSKDIILSKTSLLKLFFRSKEITIIFLT